MVLTDTDRIGIRKLMLRAPEQITRPHDILRVMAMPADVRAAIGDRMKVVLSSGHVAAYDIIDDGRMLEHLSISHPDQQHPPHAEVMVIAEAFGLGDKATWTSHMPPGMGRGRAFHIFRRIVQPADGTGQSVAP